LDNITTQLSTIANDWGIADKIVACVHDGASNVKEAGARNDWVDVHCAAHVLHLCISAAIGVNKTASTKPIARCIGAASHLVMHFHHSPLATNELLKKQLEMKPNEPTKKLIQHCKTRWNSAFHMMERLVELRWPVVAVLSDRDVTKLSDARTLDLKEDNWILMKQLLPVLQPLQMVTAMLSAECSPPASICIPMIWGLLNNHMAAKVDDSDAVRQFKADTKQELTSRFPLSEQDVTHSLVVASVADPAHKHLRAFPPDVRAAAHNNVRALLRDIALPAQDDNQASSPAAKRHCPGLAFILGDDYAGTSPETPQLMQSLTTT